jgi:DNA adenine methylase
VREIFRGFEIEEVQLSYRLSGRVSAAREVVISGP